MKQWFSVAALVAAVVFVGCGTVDLTDHGRAPANIGPLTVDRNRIGTEQPFTATCVVPAGAHNIASVEYLWGIRPAAEQASAPGVTRTSPVPPHVEEKQFTAPATAGEYVVSCTARYVFGAPDVDGNAYKDVTGEVRVRVEPCDVLRSFWGDSMQETERNYPGVSVYTDGLGGMIYDPLQSGLPAIATAFRFTDGKLSSILQTEEVETAKGSGFYMHYLLLHHRVTTSPALMLTCDSAVIEWADGTKETPAAETDNKDKEKQARIDAGLIAREAKIASVFHSDTYTLTLVVEEIDGKVVFDRVYTPRKAQ